LYIKQPTGGTVHGMCISKYTTCPRDRSTQL